VEYSADRINWTASPIVSTTSLVISELKLGNTYSFRVLAVNAIGSSIPSETIAIYFPLPPVTEMPTKSPEVKQSEVRLSFQNGKGLLSSAQAAKLGAVLDTLKGKGSLRVLVRGFTLDNPTRATQVLSAKRVKNVLSEIRSSLTLATATGNGRGITKSKDATRFVWVKFTWTE
jgi:hypothetical protein